MGKAIRSRRRLALVLALGALLPAVVTGALGPGSRAAPVATTTTSPNVTLVANVPTGSGVGGKFAGGYYFHTTVENAPAPDALADPYFRPTTSPVGGLHVLDVTVPERPVPAAFLPISIWQNEDVSLSWKRKILLIARDTGPTMGGALFVVDIAVPRAPVLRGVLEFPQRVQGERRMVGGPGHTASCILDCTYAYVAGSGDGAVYVVDLRDPNRPLHAGRVWTPAASGRREAWLGSVHDVHVDDTGHVWMSGTGGSAMYAPITDPLRPRLLATTRIDDLTRAGIPFHHGLLRIDPSTVLITEEHFGKAGCSANASNEYQEDGGLQRWKVDASRGELTFVDEWDISLRHAGADKQTCSSHWFDINRNKVVADAWYEGGVRFLDVSNPALIRPIGFLNAEGTMAGQAQFFPGRDDLLYVSDYARGLDIVRIRDGGRNAPTLHAAPPVQVPAQPRRPRSAVTRYGCLVPGLNPAGAGSSPSSS